MLARREGTGGTESPRSEADSDPGGGLRRRSKLSRMGTFLLVTSSAFLFMRAAGPFSSYGRPVTRLRSFFALKWGGPVEDERDRRAAGAITSLVDVDGRRVLEMLLVGDGGATAAEADVVTVEKVYVLGPVSSAVLIGRVEFRAPGCDSAERGWGCARAPAGLVRYSWSKMCSSREDNDDELAFDVDRSRPIVRAAPFGWCLCGVDFPREAAASPFISRLSGANLLGLCFLLTCSDSFCGDADADAVTDADADDMLIDEPLTWVSLRDLAPGRPEGPLNDGVRTWN